MIQEALMDMLKKTIPGLDWTVDYRTAPSETGTVYATGGSGALDADDMDYRYPTYQVYIRSRDWDFAKTASEIVFQTLHNKRNFTVSVDYYSNDSVAFTKTYFVYLVSAMSDPIRLGVDDDGVMDYSINFDVTLSEVKEESING